MNVGLSFYKFICYRKDYSIKTESKEGRVEVKVIFLTAPTSLLSSPIPKATVATT